MTVYFKAKEYNTKTSEISKYWTYIFFETVEVTEEYVARMIDAIEKNPLDKNTHFVDVKYSHCVV